MTTCTRLGLTIEPLDVRGADHKEEMIKLLARVITVSLETVKITDAMRDAERE